MTKLFLSSIALLACLAFSYGQNATQLKRTPYKLTVAVDKNSVYEEDIQGTAFVLPNNTIQLYPGETVYIEVEQENGTIKSMTAVKEIKDSSKTLILGFTQSTKKKVHESMMLKIANPFADNLIYKAKIYLLQQKRWVDTNVYPVQAGLSAFEMWPDIITSIGLGDWTLQSK